jgi:hypothetical protein
MKGKRISFRILAFRPIALLLLIFHALGSFGCGRAVVGRPDTFPRDLSKSAQKNPLPQLGFVIQVGAFTELERAVKLTERLQSKGLGAFYFLHGSGVYRVRFGDYPSHESAREKAQALWNEGIIEEYYIVRPDREIERGIGSADRLRESIIQTAKSFLGVPYRWGGSSEKDGFDCSGLTSAVYHLHGLRLPRSSGEQWEAGTSVSTGRLERGDLVFFATSGGRKISHVGIFIGDGKFIHAPRSGGEIRIDSLSGNYFAYRYVGARSYL